MIPLPLSRIADLTGGRLRDCDNSAAVRRICTDSREAGPGALFFALIGERVDGHVYARQAVASGAVAAVVSAGWYESAASPQGAFLVVDDPLRALGRLGAGWRRQFALPLVGITGSMGKTTTREMLAGILGVGRNLLVSPANFNTEIGVPITLLDLNAQHEAAIIEMAMRGLGQITGLCEIARPTAGIVTNVGVTHLELLGSRDAIASAKAELLAALPPEGWAVLNADDDYFEFLRARSPCPVVAVGQSGDAMVRGADVVLNSEGCASFTLEGAGERMHVQLRVPGAFHVYNALAAAAAALQFGVSLADSARALEEYAGFEKRSRLTVSPGGWWVFDDTYNASPAATAGALDSLAAMSATGRKIAILGDMRELGPDSEGFHREIGRKLAAVGPDALVTVGNLSGAIAEAALEAGYSGTVERFADSKEAAEFAASLVQSGDVVLVKGSRALEMEGIVERLLRNE